MNESTSVGQGAFGHGQVPQIGLELGSVQLVAPISKPAGSEGISVTHHPDRSWLNDDASQNIPYMSVTPEVSQPPISWLNDDARQNINFMLVTLEVTQLSISWLNDNAS